MMRFKSALLAVILGVVSVSCWDRDDGKPPKMELRAAPGFILATSTGSKVKLEEFKGTVTIVHFWATWCPPCLEELPKLLKFAESYKDRAIKFVAVSLDSNWEDALKTFPNSLASKAGIVSLIDPSLKSSEEYGSFQFPETYILNKKHEIISKLVGIQDWQGNDMKELVEKILQDAAKF
jgi:cytochrome c biogenesis protein CcmG, thiol:disulfide interchange protein DsbE